MHTVILSENLGIEKHVNMLDEEQLKEAFAIFGLETREERAAASFENLRYTQASCIVKIYEMGDIES